MYRIDRMKGKILCHEQERRKRTCGQDPSRRPRRFGGDTSLKRSGDLGRRDGDNPYCHKKWRATSGGACKLPAGHLQTLVPSASCLVPSPSVPCNVWAFNLREAQDQTTEFWSTGVKVGPCQKAAIVRTKHGSHL